MTGIPALTPRRDEPPAPHHTSVGAVLKEALYEWSEDKAMRLSAALALYTILSLAPLLVITIKVLSLMFGKEFATGQVQRKMDLLIGSVGSKAVQDIIASASKPGAGIIATAISSIILIWSASAVFGELQDSLDTIWKVKPKPNASWWVTIRKRLLSIGMIFVVAFLLLVSLVISTTLTMVAGRFVGEAGWGTLGTDAVVSVVGVSLLIAMIFRILPDVRLAWRDVIVGAVVTGILFKVGQYLLGLYFRFGTSANAYGAAGSFVAILIWVYYSSWILYFGAEFTKVWVKHKGRSIVPAADAVPVTEEERARQGMVSRERLDRTARRQEPPGRDAAGPGRRAEPQSSDWEVKEQEWD